MKKLLTIIIILLMLITAISFPVSSIDKESKSTEEKISITQEFTNTGNIKTSGYKQTPDTNIKQKKSRSQDEKVTNALSKLSGMDMTEEERKSFSNYYNIKDNKVIDLISKGKNAFEILYIDKTESLGYTLEDAILICSVGEPNVAWSKASSLEDIMNKMKMSDADKAIIRQLYAARTSKQNVFVIKTSLDRLGISINEYIDSLKYSEILTVSDYEISKKDLMLLEETVDTFYLNINLLAGYCQKNKITVEQLSCILTNTTSVGSPATKKQMANKNTLASKDSLVYKSLSTQTTTQSGDYSPSTDFTALSPYKFNEGVNEAIGLVGGELSYSEHDLVIPGRNGLDFSLSTKYSSNDSNLSDPAYSVNIQTETTTNTTYEFVSGTVHTYCYEYVINPDTGMTELYSSDYNYYSFSSQNDFNVFVYNHPNYSTEWHYGYWPGYGETTGYEEYGCSIDSVNDTPVTTTTTQVVNVDGTNYASYKEYNSSWSSYTYWETYNNIGTGWSFGFDRIGIDNFQPTYFHFGDGMSYAITAGSTVDLPAGATKSYTLSGRGLRDCILYDHDGSFQNGLGGWGFNSAYMLVYKNGTKEYFNQYGQLIGVVDRFGNAIKLSYDMPYVTTPMQVITTGGQTLDFVWTTVGYTKTLEVKLSSQTLQTYTFSQISGEFLKWQLSSKTDRYGNVKTYSYGKYGASANFFLPSVNAEPVTIYYNLLTQVTYATGASTQYTYTAFNRQLKDDNCQYTGGTLQYYRITKRCEDTEYNIKSYSYNLGSYTDGKAASGTITDSLGVRTVIDYDGNQLPVQQSIYDGQTLKKRISTSYTSTKLPYTVTTETFNDTESAAVSERYVYDYYDKGDLTVYWSTRANNNFVTSNPATVLYSYDNTYHQLISKTYYSDANTKIEELYTLTGDKKHVITAITEVNDVVSAKTDYDYDVYGNVTKVRAYPNPALTTGYIDADMAYSNGVFLTEKSTGGVVDSDGNLIAASGTSAAGVVKQSFTYDMYGNVLTATDGNGNTTSTTYDAQNRPLVTTNPDSTTVTREYDNANNTTTITDEMGTVLLYDYDSLGNLVSISDFTDEDAVIVLTQYQYDYQGRKLSETNAADYADYACKTYEYDNFNRVTATTITGSTGEILSCETSTYTDLFDLGDGIKCSMVMKALYTDGEPIVAYSLYNLYGDLFAAKNALNGVYCDTFTYDLLGRKTSEKTAQAEIDYPAIAYTAKWDYDFRGNVVKEYNAEGNYITYAYDGIGRKVSVTDYSNNTTTITYDNLGRALTQNVPFEYINNTTYYAVTKTDYDRNGNVVQTRMQNNEPGAAADWSKTRNEYNNRNFLTSVTNYIDNTPENVVTYTYNGAGSVLTQTTGTHTTTYTYDRYQNVATLEDALSQTEEYAYTPNGTLVSKTDRNGTGFAYGVDGFGRTLTTYASGGAVSQTHTTAYNYGGQVSSISADGITTSYTYDGYGRVVLELNLVSPSASGMPSQKAYTYDLSGRMLTSAVTVNGVTNTTSYQYDRLGRVVTVKENGETEATYTYDANGNRATMTLGNGEVTTYTYNLANMVKTLVNKDESNNTLSSCSYLYRLDGNQVGKQEGTKTTLYAYDDLGRLTAEAVTENQTTVTTGYTFDAYNNRMTKTTGASTTAYTYDANNRMLTETASEGTTNYTYDNNGNQLTTTIGASTTTNTYDLFGQLKSYTGTNNVVTNYAYGPDGLRVSKASGNTVTTFVWDGGNIINEFISVTEGQTTTTTENRYVYGIGRIKAYLDTTEVYYLYNAHGDVTGLTDGSCNLTKSYVYDAFGIEVNPDPADANPFRYCGEYFDKETETYYLRARNYNPSTGRFTQQDGWDYIDMADPLSLNLYLYCNNNPVNYVDPSGHSRLPEDDIENDIERDSGSIEFENDTETDIEKFWEAIDYLMNSKTASDLIELLMSSDVTITIHFINLWDYFTGNNEDHYDYENNIIYWDYDKGMISGDGKYVVSSAIMLAHEMGHAAQDISGYIDKYDPEVFFDKTEILKTDVDNLIQYENPIEKELNEWVRYDYYYHLGGYKVNSPSEHGMIKTSYWLFFPKKELGPIIRTHGRKGRM